MRRLAMIAAAFAFVSFAPPLATTAQAQVNIYVGSGRMSCYDGVRYLRSRGYWDVVRRDCGGRYYVYRAWRDGRRYEIAMRASDGRIVDRRRIR